jgi:two-component system, chemotaxis family, chemotaxis protein CheY
MSKRVLIVEDDIDIRDSLKVLLQMEKYSVDVASNGREALDVLAESSASPDLILLDLMMPLMDGATFLKHLRAATARHWDEIPVVVLSASRQRVDGNISDYVHKPVDVDHLLSVVQKFSGNVEAH